MNKKRKKIIRYINSNIGDIGIDCRIDILNHIAINERQDILYFEGTGTRILYNELSEKILHEIKDIIDEDLNKHKIDFSMLDI